MNRFEVSTGVLMTLLLGVADFSFAVEPLTPPSRPPAEWNGPPGGQVPPGFDTVLPGADPYHLLMHSRKVQNELGLTKDQLHRLFRADRDFRTGMRDVGNPQDAAASDGDPTIQRGPIEQHLQKTKGVIAKVLTPVQIRRLQEITFQINGPCVVLMDTQLAGPLRLMSEQQDRVKTLCSEMAAQMRATRNELNGMDAVEQCAMLKEIRQKMQQLRQDTNRRITDLFSEAQAASYARLIGKPFVLDPNEGPPCPSEGRVIGGPGGARRP